MKPTEKDAQAFKVISQVWEKAGLDFKRTILMFTPLGDTKEELEADAAFKQLAREELEKEGKRPEKSCDSLHGWR